MKVYVVSYRSYDDNEIVAVYLTKEAAEFYVAQAAKEKLTGYDIEELETADGGESLMKEYFVTISTLNGEETISRYEGSHLVTESSFRKAQWFDNLYGAKWGTASGRTFEEAEKKLRDAYATA